MQSLLMPFIGLESAVKHRQMQPATSEWRWVRMRMTPASQLSPSAERLITCLFPFFLRLCKSVRVVQVWHGMAWGHVGSEGSHDLVLVNLADGFWPDAAGPHWDMWRRGGGTVGPRARPGA